ncbi:TIGR02594 family protein [Propylenella binzhouense]|uniref:TIGR02594 family protein n=1 Tax=Propylenella binzhouense TaxID=2555902 RepID=A0A964T8B0_9HYPH|nr:TIGR02594 family protein [Propylenella binzhouense]MYZ50401.1 TIGR02594 family protein [Propylenella binzhouense]
MTTLEIQRRLAALGYDPGPLDGIRGRLTIAAVKRFQTDRGLLADGIAGPLTIAALFPEPAGASAQALPWYAEAERLMGTREIAGRQHNPAIIGWARRLGLGYRDDETPWCGLFVAHCIAAALPDEALPANPLGARNWLRFGAAAPAQKGAVLVFSRPGSSWSGHVGFHAGEDATAFHVLGGNQSNAVNVARIARSRLLGARWPRSAAFARSETMRAAGGGVLSANEA